jgi:HD-GYP domain-containing protein (c-di-GMP phosphodiesterase class II)
MGDEIPLLAQIVAVVDVFDALTTTRPYREALTAQTAYEILVSEAAAGWCPPKMVQTFVDLHRKRYPEMSFRPDLRRAMANVAQRAARLRPSTLRA